MTRSIIIMHVLMTSAKNTYMTAQAHRAKSQASNKMIYAYMETRIL